MVSLSHVVQVQANTGETPLQHAMTSSKLDHVGNKVIGIETGLFNHNNMLNIKLQPVITALSDLNTKHTELSNTFQANHTTAWLKP